VSYFCLVGKLIIVFRCLNSQFVLKIVCILDCNRIYVKELLSLYLWLIVSTILQWMWQAWWLDLKKLWNRYGECWKGVILEEYLKNKKKFVLNAEGDIIIAVLDMLTIVEGDVVSFMMCRTQKNNRVPSSSLIKNIIRCVAEKRKRTYMSLRWRSSMFQLIEKTQRKKMLGMKRLWFTNLFQIYREKGERIRYQWEVFETWKNYLFYLFV
jgi:hypothetical protein